MSGHHHKPTFRKRFHTAVRNVKPSWWAKAGLGTLFAGWLFIKICEAFWTYAVNDKSLIDSIPALSEQVSNLSFTVSDLQTESRQQHWQFYSLSNRFNLLEKDLTGGNNKKP